MIYVAWSQPERQRGATDAASLALGLGRSFLYDSRNLNERGWPSPRVC